MLAEFLDSIVHLADKRRTPDKLDLPGDKLLVTNYGPNGEPQVIDRPPARRAYHLDSLSSFITALAMNATKPAVFVVGGREVAGAISVIGFLDETNRRERVTLVVHPSDATIALLELDRPCKQAQVVKVLRDRLFSSVEPGLLGKLRTLDFRRRNDGSSVKEHGRESLGRSVEATVKSKNGDIPEHTAFDLPWFASRDFEAFRATVNMAIDLDAVNETISFCPRGDDLQLAQQDAIKFLADQVRAAAKGILPDDMPMMLGTPDETANRC